MKKIDNGTRLELLHQRWRATKHQFNFPEKGSFSDFFEAYGYDKKDVVADPTCPRISNYCQVSIGGSGYSHALYVRPTQELLTWMKANMLIEQGTNFKIVIYDDGTALVLVSYDQILGSRWLSLVDSSTVPAKKEV